MIIITDVPGAGKTASVTYAVDKCPGAGYMRVRASEKAGALISLKKKVTETCSEWAKSKKAITRAELDAQFTPFCKNSLYRLFELYKAEVMQLKVCIVLICHSHRLILLYC